ncbi:MAG: hypothetical protein AB7V32_05885 [Candidatus Berkiella sp.]
MALAGMNTTGMNNFQVIASYEALKVLLEDDYFQDLPQNWRNIIGKIQEKLTHKEQSARFQEKLNSLACVQYDEVRATLPDAVKHLIAALNNHPPASPSATPDLSPEFGRSYTPRAVNSKMPRQQPRCREEEQRPEELSRHRLVPRLVN